MKVLVTAFEPFGGEELNASMEALRTVPDMIGEAQIVKVYLPVVFGRSLEMLRETIRTERPDAVLCLGEAGGRTAITPERVAINLSDARIPDNDGRQPVDERIFADGPDAFFSTLPTKAMAAAIKNAGVPAELSNSAGTFVCNQLMYGLMYFIAHEFPGLPGGFMHVPYLLEQAANHPGKAGFSRAELTRGVMAAIGAIVNSRQYFRGK